MDVRKLKSLEQDEVEKLLFQTDGSETEEDYSELDHSAVRKLAKKRRVVIDHDPVTNKVINAAKIL